MTIESNLLFPRLVGARERTKGVDKCEGSAKGNSAKRFHGKSRAKGGPGVVGKCVDPGSVGRRPTDKLVARRYLLRFSLVRSKGALRGRSRGRLRRGEVGQGSHISALVRPRGPRRDGMGRKSL